MIRDKLIGFFQSHRFLVDVIRFGLVGVVASVVDIGLLNLFYLKTNANLYVATGLAFVAASVVAYWLNNRWTYKRLGLQFGAQNLIKYTIIGTVGLVLTEIIMRVLVGNQGLNYNLAKVIAIFLVFFWNFFGNRFWTFRLVASNR